MARLDEYIFGYRLCRVEPRDAPRLVNALLKLGICSTVSPLGEFTVREKDRRKFTAYARSRVRYEMSQPLGIYGFIERSKHRYGAFLALFFLTLVIVLSGRLVWDVRIEGNDRLSEYAVEDALSKAGFHVGAPWRSIDKKKIETGILANNPDIAWISLNRRGTVAYVRIIESENIGAVEVPAPLYSNIVADRDGVIEQITVNSGEAVVKAGDVVRAGDVLISGVVESEGGVHFCRASGEVRAQAVGEVYATAPRNETEKAVLKHRIAQIRVVLFNFSINIFKNYRNCEETCDIIEEIREFALFDRFKLPIRIERSYSVQYEETIVSRTSDEMTDAARRELDSRIYSLFKDADVLKLRTTGEFVGDVYRLTSRVVYATDIGKESEIQTN